MDRMNKRSRRDILRMASTAFWPAAESLPTRSFWLFKLLKPTHARVSPIGTSRLHCTSAGQSFIIEGDSVLNLHLSSAPTRVTGPADTLVAFNIEIPGQLRRDFFGTLQFVPLPDILLIKLETNIETATSCVVGAELPVAAAHFEALCVQAIASRSVLFGTTVPRHVYGHTCAHFCDTTHCQFFRSPALPSSSVARATTRTRGLILAQDNLPVAPLYSGACGGVTNGGWNNGVLYESAICACCRRRQTKRRGHGWGLCQEGAMDLAAAGHSYKDILRTYYQNLTLQQSLQV